MQGFNPVRGIGIVSPMVEKAENRRTEIGKGYLDITMSLLSSDIVRTSDGPQRAGFDDHWVYTSTARGTDHMLWCVT